MALLSLPIIFINMGGEMIYILDQRLRAQKIPTEKAVKVIQDIITTMFHGIFLEELFKPQELYTKQSLRMVFDNLAHASIMRLNPASMDKLYDLMVMAVKYQLLLSPQPRDILLVTLNHLDSIRELASLDLTRTLIGNVYSKLTQTYGELNNGDFQMIRQSLLHFLQDYHIKVSVLLKDKVQNTDGHFAMPTCGPVPCGSDIPGSIKYFSDKGEVTRMEHFSSGGDYGWALAQGMLTTYGDRVIRLGLNLYDSEGKEELSDPQSGQGRSQEPLPHYPDEECSPGGQAELTLLSQLIRSSANNQTNQDQFKLKLFTADENESDDAAEVLTKHSYEEQFLNLDASQGSGREELCRILGEMAVESEAGGPAGQRNLLDLLDEAGS